MGWAASQLPWSQMSEIKRHSFFNRLVSYRVGIALHLKRVPFETRTDNIRAGDHHEAVKI